MKLTGLDHLVLTVRDIGRTVDFYQDALGMTVSAFAGGRLALKFGLQKINLHQAGEEFSPHAARPAPGTADVCFTTDRPIAEWVDHFADLEIPLVEGPVPRAGALGPMMSVYIRDPDGNCPQCTLLPWRRQTSSKRHGRSEDGTSVIQWPSTRASAARPRPTS